MIDWMSIFKATMRYLMPFDLASTCSAALVHLCKPFNCRQYWYVRPKFTRNATIVYGCIIPFLPERLLIIQDAVLRVHSRYRDEALPFTNSIVHSNVPLLLLTLEPC